MQTNFSLAQLADPHVAESEKILRKCVHCGFCTATCPTYVTLGNELDSPRGRIYLIKDMLENGRPADKEIVTHIDRCLSCLACMTTCPSGVNYMHLVDHARAHIQETYKRPLLDRLTRAMLAAVLPYPDRFRAALRLAGLGRPFIGLFERLPGLKPVAAMLKLAPPSIPPASPMAKPGAHAGQGTKRGRVAILTGCAQSVLDPAINDTTISLLTRLGVEVVVPEGEGCCGALVHHMGREAAALASARRNVDAWTRAIDRGGLDLPEPVRKPGTVVAYHSACSMQHGQKITRQPKELLAKAGFVVREPREGHLCCGSAGTYNILQPEISAKLRDRKVKNIEATGASVVATGNIGCITQIASAAKLPVVHTIKLLDWAYGGPKPEGVSEAKLVAAE
ncbi:MAG: 4Fe-4S dicluster domain-containing protein [Alphaproteobacteria bacterium]|nr:4Fe-4S dicluster domain-containing protein [Alphaproteobacteria bacterium]